MAERSVGKADLNAEIARRVVTQPQDQDPPLSRRIVGYSISLLKEDRSFEAAALYEYACREDPADPQANNNLGFCLIPTAPERALDHLHAALRLGYQPAIVNMYNQACCYALLGRRDAVIKIADSVSVDGSCQDPVGATLWIMTAGGKLELAERADPKRELHRLVRYISES